MDTSSTLMGVGLLLVFLAPILYLIIDQNRREKARKKTLFNAARSNNLEISNYDLLRGLSIGMDKKSRKLLVISAANDNKPVIIPLDKLQDLNLEKRYLSDQPTTSLEEINEITLLLEGKEIHTAIDFYRAAYNPVTEKEMRLQKAQQWKNLLLEVRQ